MVFRTLLILLLSTLSAIAGTLDQGRALIDEGKFKEARPLLVEALRSPGAEAEATLLLTRACNELGDWEAGVKYGKRSLKLLPDSSDAHFQYAIALRIKMTNVSKTRAMFTVGAYKDELKTAIRLDPKNVDALTERIGFLINAPGIAGGDLDDAEEELPKLEGLDRLAAEQLRLAIEINRGNTLAAIKVSKGILKDYPDDTEARSALGYLLQQNRQFEEADLQFAKLAEGEDRELALGALYQRARTRILGAYQLDEAIAMLEKYIKGIGAGMPHLPSKAAALWRMGLAEEGLGRPERARGLYEEALRLEPDFKEARTALKKLK